MPETEVAPEVRDLSRRLLPEVDALGLRMADRIRAEIPLYAEGELVDHERLVRSCTDNLRFVLGILAGDPADLDTPRATGTARAREGVPYASVLQAFRVGGRFIWELLVERADPEVRDVLLLAAADIWAVSDDLAAAVTEAYRTALADRARREEQMRSVLVSALLDGDEVTDQPWETAEVLQLEGHDFVVVSAECPLPGTEALPDAEPMLRRHDVVSAWRLDHEHQDGLVALRAGVHLDRLADLLAEHCAGRVGLGTTFERLEGAHGSRREARLACAAATPGSREVVRFDQHPLAVLLASAPEQAASMTRAVLGPVLDLPSEDGAVLLDTARAWLAAAGATSSAAEQLHLHRNTVRYRVRRLQELTGRDLAHPRDAAELHVALECARVLGLDQGTDARHCPSERGR